MSDQPAYKILRDNIAACFNAPRPFRWPHGRNHARHNVGARESSAHSPRYGERGDIASTGATHDQNQSSPVSKDSRRGKDLPFSNDSQKLGDNAVVVESFKNIQENLTGVGIKLAEHNGPTPAFVDRCSLTSEVDWSIRCHRRHHKLHQDPRVVIPIFAW